MNTTRSGASGVPPGTAGNIAGIVAVLPGPEASVRGHEYASLVLVARKLAALQGYSFVGDFVAKPQNEGSNAWHDAQHCYLVPSDTLVGIERAQALGIRSERDLFGGVVPSPYVATKVISHPLVDTGAIAPPDWRPEFLQEAGAVVLPGYSAFCSDDALRAGRQLLGLGPVRLKPAAEKGGRGQSVLHSEAELAAALQGIPEDSLTREGVVLEQNLVDVKTLSIGQVRVGDRTVSYWGTQAVTTNHAGRDAYGGSRITAVPGGFDVLLAFSLPPTARVAVQQACAYDAAAHRCFPGLIASRCNYDIVQGRDAQGAWRSGVLEQSWRVGGASGAELAALEAFAADSDLPSVTAQAVEIFGPCPEPPAGATVYFRGEDERAGMITKYTIVEPDVRS